MSAPEPALAWHALDPAAVTDALDTDPRADSSATRRLRAARVRRPEPAPARRAGTRLRILARQFKSLIVVLLVAAASPPRWRAT